MKARMLGWFSNLIFTSTLIICFSCQAQADCVGLYEGLSAQRETAKTAGAVGTGVGVASVGMVAAAKVVGVTVLTVSGWGLVVVGVVAAGGLFFGYYQKQKVSELDQEINVLTLYRQAKEFQQAKLEAAQNPSVSSLSESPLPFELAVLVELLNPEKDPGVTERIVRLIVSAMDVGVLCSSNSRLYNSGDLLRLLRARLHPVGRRIYRVVP